MSKLTNKIILDLKKHKYVPYDFGIYTLSSAQWWLDEFNDDIKKCWLKDILIHMYGKTRGLCIIALLKSEGEL